MYNDFIYVFFNYMYIYINYSKDIFKKKILVVLSNDINIMLFFYNLIMELF